MSCVARSAIAGFVALVRIVSSAGHKILDSLRNNIRKSDEYVRVNYGVAAVMSETNASDALTGIERMISTIRNGSELSVDVSTYPTDGRESSLLLEVAENRLKRAQQGSNGAIVWQNEKRHQTLERQWLERLRA